MAAAAPFASPSAAGHLFLFGLATGLAILAMTAYFAMSPRWLRWVLVACGAATMSRYLAMAVFTVNPDPPGHALWSRCWFATVIGLTFPSAVAIDQLVRHPAMTPKKLLRWYAPFLFVFALVILFGPKEVVPIPSGGVTLNITGPARWLLALAETAFAAGVLWLGALLLRKLAEPRTRLALGGLIAAYAYLATDGIIVASGAWYPIPFFYSEMLALVALWVAFDTARRQAA